MKTERIWSVPETVFLRHYEECKKYHHFVHDPLQVSETRKETEEGGALSFPDLPDLSSFTSFIALPNFNPFDTATAIPEGIKMSILDDSSRVIQASDLREPRTRKMSGVEEGV